MASGLIRHRCRGFCARPGSAIKKTLLAVERARSDVAKLRDVWIHKRQPIMHGLTAPWLLEGAMDRTAFDVYIETQLAPTLQPGDVVILDNLNVHESAKAAAVLAARGAWFLFLPAYSPDLNPIEMAFAKLKAHLRAARARTYDALWRAVGDICSLFEPRECWNFLRHAGYASD